MRWIQETQEWFSSSRTQWPPAWSLNLIPQNFRVIGQRLRQGVVKPLPWTAVPPGIVTFEVRMCFPVRRKLRGPIGSGWGLLILLSEPRKVLIFFLLLWILISVFPRAHIIHCSHFIFTGSTKRQGSVTKVIPWVCVIYFTPLGRRGGLGRRGHLALGWRKKRRCEMGSDGFCWWECK